MSPSCFDNTVHISGFLLTINFSPIHLEHIMPLDALHCLPQILSSAMLMIWMGCLMLMKNDALPLTRILRVMDIPDMPRILRLNRHIVIFRQNNVKVRLIQLLYLFRPEHLHPLLSRTMPPALPPQSLLPPQISHQ